MLNSLPHGEWEQLLAMLSLTHRVLSRTRLFPRALSSVGMNSSLAAYWSLPPHPLSYRNFQESFLQHSTCTYSLFSESVSGETQLKKNLHSYPFPTVLIKMA